MPLKALKRVDFPAGSGAKSGEHLVKMRKHVEGSVKDGDFSEEDGE